MEHTFVPHCTTILSSTLRVSTPTPNRTLMKANDVVEATGENVVVSLVARVLKERSASGGIYCYGQGDYRWLDLGIFVPSLTTPDSPLVTDGNDKIAGDASIGLYLTVGFGLRRLRETYRWHIRREH